jgi:hypothetical protein
MINIRCVHDLVLATTIQTTGRFGYFELVFFDGGDVLSLKAPTLECAEKWVENLVARQQMFVKHAPTNDHQRRLQTRTAALGSLILKKFILTP